MEVSKYYRGIYTFTKNGKKIPMPKFAVNIFAKEYMRKRNAACDCLNPFYESWNSEYTGTEPDDDIYSEKSREYNWGEYGLGVSTRLIYGIRLFK